MLGYTVVVSVRLTDTLNWGVFVEDSDILLYSSPDLGMAVNWAEAWVDGFGFVELSNLAHYVLFGESAMID